MNSIENVSEHLDKIDKQSQNDEKKLVTYALLLVVLVQSATRSEWKTRAELAMARFSSLLLEHRCSISYSTSLNAS